MTLLKFINVVIKLPLLALKVPIDISDKKSIVLVMINTIEKRERLVHNMIVAKDVNKSHVMYDSEIITADADACPFVFSVAKTENK